MKVGIRANMVDNNTSKIGDALRSIFKALSNRLEGDYGGLMEHLWIDFELIERHAKPDGKPKFPFRFAKRVPGRSHLGLPPSPDHFNVGHFSVRPDFRLLLSIPEEKAIEYCLSLIYKELLVLEVNEKKLDGFNSALFKSKFFEECRNMGYRINQN